MKNNTKGAVLTAVIITTIVVGIIVASLLDLLNTQRRLNLRKELQLQANEAAETSVDYAYSYIINDINSNTLSGASSIPSTGYRAFSFPTTAQNFLRGTVVTSYSGLSSGITLTNPDVRVLAAGTKSRFYLDGADPANAGDPNRNQWVEEQLVPIVTAATASQAGQSYTAYIQKGISSREIALFQYAIFFQGQLHLHRGYGLMGGVHANGNLFLNAHSGDNAIYNGAVTSAHHIYRGSTFDVGGTGSDPFGYVAVTTEATGGYADTTTSPTFAPVATGTGGSLKIYSDTTGSVNNYVNLNILDCRTSTWKTDAENLFKTHLEDSAMESPLLAPVGSVGYSQDSKATPAVNEFNNAPYTLLEPNLPSLNAYHQTSLTNNLEAKASLLLIVEYNNSTAINLHRISDGGVQLFNSGTDLNTTTNPAADLNLYSDPWRMFIVKAYKVSATWDPSLGTDIHNYLTPITLPTNAYHVIGKASADVTKIIPGEDLKFEDFDVALSCASPLISVIDTLLPGTAVCSPIASLLPSVRSNIDTISGMSVTVNTGIFDSRLGRGVAPITIDIDALKRVMEAPLATLTPTTGSDYLFRTDFDPTAMLPVGLATKAQWNGLIYIEFPTSLTIGNTTPGVVPPILNIKNGINSRRFAYSSTPELLHPDRWDVTDNYGRVNRTDGIVPFAPQLRRYPPAASANLNSVILDAQYVIPAVQVINGGVLPHPNSSRGLNEGFTIATNAPLYLVGNFNADGDYNTGTNFSGTSPTSYATADSSNEIPAALFCDTFTVLSNGWGMSPGGFRSNRQNSFYGANAGSTNGNGSASAGTVGSPPGRPSRARAADTVSKYSITGGYCDGALYPASAQYVEISACVATGEYPIFEFFTHALENYYSLYAAIDSTHPNPIIFKGSVVAMFHSEIQHIKQAYGRNVNNDIQTYYQQHGAFAIAAVRYHTFLVNGFFPPGTPTLYVTQPKNFRLLHWNDSADSTLLTSAGYTAP